LNADALSDLALLKRGGEAPIAVALTAAARTFTVNSTGDQPDANPGDGKCETAANNGVCTLRAAVAEVNAGPGGDAINFSVSSTTSTGFQLQKSATVDGGANRIEISGAGISIVCVSGSTCGGNSTIRGFVINRFAISPATAIRIDANGGNNFIENNYIGTDTSGANAAFGNITTGDGVSISRSPNNTIGGTASAARNILVMPGTGVRISDQSPGTKVQGNYIGTDVSGTKALGTAVGVSANAGGNTSPNQTIGGAVAGAGNVIACSGDNVRVQGESGILVQGNLIGTNAAGAAKLGSTPTTGGVTFSGGSGATGFTVGGTTPAARNVIAGHRFGVSISFPSSLALVQGNYIGADISGTKALANGTGTGVLIGRDASGSTVG
ncbi:MAG: CSLREA domain-containing protein, partial [Gammaproteobacteria bacterium]